VGEDHFENRELISVYLDRNRAWNYSLL